MPEGLDLHLHVFGVGGIRLSLRVEFSARTNAWLVFRPIYL